MKRRNQIHQRLLGFLKRTDWQILPPVAGVLAFGWWVQWSVAGGDAAANTLTVASNYNTVNGYLVLAYSLSGTSVPAGCGTLTQITADFTLTGLSGLVFAGVVTDSDLEFEYYCSGN